MATCEHDIRESKRGVGPCQIEAEVKLRNGLPNWWCRTHGMKASGPGGAPLSQCPGAWLEPLPDEQILELDASKGELAIWGAISPAIALGHVDPEPGKVHVHHRVTAQSAKDVDQSYELVRVHNVSHELLVEGMAAVAFSVSELAHREVTPLTCPHCGEVHIDEQKFATFAHTKHLCNSCGRNFREKSPTISNPLADANKQLGLPTPFAPERPDRPLTLTSTDFRGIAMWPSNSAIVNTMSRPEELGIHVHAWDLDGTWVIDETYSSVEIDGFTIPEDTLRLLAVQRELAHGSPIVALDCHACDAALMSPSDDWLEPSTHHPCMCGADTRTRRRSFVNPLVSRFPVLP